MIRVVVEVVGPLGSFGSLLIEVELPFEFTLLLVVVLVEFKLEVELRGTVAVVFDDDCCDGLRIDELVDVVDAFTAAAAVTTLARVAAAAADDVVVLVDDDELALGLVGVAVEPVRLLCCC